MKVVIERTSKKLKLLRATALVGICVGGAAYLFGDFSWSYAVVVAAFALWGVSKLLIWWFHD